MNPDQYCQEKCAASGSSFYYSFLFLPAERRRAIMALYAFCREVDDVVNECNDISIASTKLSWWRQEIERVANGQPQHPVGLALKAVSGQFNLPKEQLLEIIDGMEMDLQQTRYLDFKSLSLYCYRVASVVGLLAAEIFGFKDRQTQKYAHDLGMAFQLTNIIRDIGEDARRGRIYIPMDELKQFNVPAADILNAKYSDNFTALMQFQSRTRREILRPGFCPVAGGQPQEPAPRPDHGGNLPHAARRDQARKLPGPAPAHRADPGPQTLDRLENLGLRMKVAVIGGGWAGIAAAVELTAAGVSTTLYEAGRQPGGRARAVETDGRRLDNGQHILLGAYRETLALMRQVGADPELLLERRPLQVVDQTGFRLALPKWPAPLNVAWGLLTATGVGWREKLATARWMQGIKARHFRLQHDLSVAEWLDAAGQNGALRRHLWEPLCLAALNIPAERASAQVFANVLRDSLGSALREDTDLLLPRVDLGGLLPEPASNLARRTRRDAALLHADRCARNRPRSCRSRR